MAQIQILSKQDAKLRNVVLLYHKANL